MKLRRSSRYESDIASTLDYIADDDPRAAVRLLDVVEAKTALLIDNPELGRPGRVAGTRELVIAGTKYIAVYRVYGEEIQLLRLLHGARQWSEG